MFIEWPIKDIIIANDRRELQDIKILAESIEKRGLINPITITDDCRLIAGYHRLKACEFLGWETIPVHVLNIDELEARLTEIDENLMRRAMSALECAVLLNERKKLYEAKYPQTRHGGYRRSKDGRELASNVPCFAERTAQKTNYTQRTIRRFISIAKRLDLDVRKTIINTPLANRTRDLIDLSRLEPISQKRVVQKALANPEVKIQKLIQEEKIKASLTQKFDSSYAPQIQTGDTLDFLKSIEPRSVDLLVTNPPQIYCDSTISNWLPHALATLKTTGQAYIFTDASTSKLETYLDALKDDPDFVVVNVLVRTFKENPDSKRKYAYKPNCNFIFYLRGLAARTLNFPVPEEQFVVQAADSKAEMAERLIRHSTRKNDIVLDPFAGTGTILEAAARLGRKPLGCDRNYDTLRHVEQCANQVGCTINS